MPKERLAVMSARATPAEYAVVRAAAATAEQNVSDWIRAVALRAARQQLTLADTPTTVLPRVGR